MASLSATQVAGADGQAALRAGLLVLAREVLPHAQPVRVCAGLSGFGGEGSSAAAWLAEAFALPLQAVQLRSDIEIACLDSFAPGEAYLVYAGTGSIAAWMDSDGVLHRAGGRGVTLDDGGGGFWIAREALRQIWRREDEAPGVWRQSVMAQALFAMIGGSDWDHSRRFVYGQERGAVGRLALAVAASADADPAARELLQLAGQELARLALALVGRYGARPIVLAGRAAGLHALIEESMRAALPPDLQLTRRTLLPHHAAARLALHSAA